MQHGHASMGAEAQYRGRGGLAREHVQVPELPTLLAGSFTAFKVRAPMPYSSLAPVSAKQAVMVSHMPICLSPSCTVTAQERAPVPDGARAHTPPAPPAAPEGQPSPPCLAAAGVS